MNKAELIQALVDDKHNRLDTKAAAQDALEAVLNAIMKGVKPRNKKETPQVQLIGFGTFKLKIRKKRKGRNPKTKEVITIPESRTITFKPGKKLKDLIN